MDLRNGDFEAILNRFYGIPFGPSGIEHKIAFSTRARVVALFPAIHIFTAFYTHLSHY
jgi:hypothetical protein